MFFCSEIDGPTTGGLNGGGDVYAGGLEAIVISGMNEYPRPGGYSTKFCMGRLRPFI